MSEYHVITTQDGLPMIVRGQIGEEPADVGRALTTHDGEAIVAELRRINGLGSAGLRERVLSEVTDAIENCFEAGNG